MMLDAATGNAMPQATLDNKIGLQPSGGFKGGVGAARPSSIGLGICFSKSPFPVSNAYSS